MFIIIDDTTFLHRIQTRVFTFIDIRELDGGLWKYRDMFVYRSDKLHSRMEKAGVAVAVQC